MTAQGQRTAKAPALQYANLAAVARIGATKHGSAIWQLVCECGQALEADVPAIKRGSARCPDCNPTYGDLEAQRILAVLPATIDEIVERSAMTLQQVRYRLTVMKPELCHTGKWRRPSGSGACRPVIVAGPGEDVPCTLKPRDNAESKRRYRKRIQKAIKRAMEGGKEDVRYIRYIARHKARLTAKQTRAQPQTWLSALMG